MSGIEDPLPRFGNHKLRMAELLKHTVQSQNPMMAQRLQQNPDAVQILTNRLEFFRNQIQQYEQNPLIGRALQTATFDKRQAPALTESGTGAPGAGGGY